MPCVAWCARWLLSELKTLPHLSHTCFVCWRRMWPRNVISLRHLVLQVPQKKWIDRKWCCSSRRLWKFSRHFCKCEEDINRDPDYLLQWVNLLRIVTDLLEASHWLWLPPHCNRHRSPRRLQRFPNGPVMRHQSSCSYQYSSHHREILLNAVEAVRRCWKQDCNRNMRLCWAEVRLGSGKFHWTLHGARVANCAASGNQRNPFRTHTPHKRIDDDCLLNIASPFARPGGTLVFRSVCIFVWFATAAYAPHVRARTVNGPEHPTVLHTYRKRCPRHRFPPRNICLWNRTAHFAMVCHEIVFSPWLFCVFPMFPNHRGSKTYFGDCSTVFRQIP